MVIYRPFMTQSADSFILEMNHISKSFAGVQALRDVSFACRQGIVHALVGENGAGKSTLIKILAGAYQADSGEIIFKGKRRAGFTTREALDSGIRIIYQEMNLASYLTVAENIFLGREPRTRLGLIDTRRMYEDSATLLKSLGVSLDLRTPVGELTVASQQMVEIAKALSHQADVIVMDEPSAILAGHELEQLFSIIKSLVAQGVTIVYISHRLDEVFEVASEVTVLKDGAVVGTYPVAELTRSKLVHLMVGRSLDEVFPRGNGQRGAPVLVAQDVTADPAPDHVSLTLHAGEILGLAGMVGSGRSELAQALFGAVPLKDGRITLKGTALRGHSPGHAVERGLVLVPEDRKTQGLFLELSVRSNATLAILKRLTRFGLIQRRKEIEAVETVRRDLSIKMASLEQEVQYLSGGNQQKVVLAKWLVTSPAVVILDEPTRGIDVGAKFEIYLLMRRLTDRGVAILMISSELPEILGMSDRILVMRDGRIAGELSPEEATEARIIALATSSQSVDHGHPADSERGL
jgi:ribose transport system ATP-binding protein